MPNPTLADRLAPARESWRPEREASDGGRLIGWAALLVAAVACLGALAGGGYALLRGHKGGVPVIEADSRPIRVKPANPGGMQISGEEEQLMDGGDAAHADVMAPGPEVPAPQLLAAEIQAAHPPDPATPAPAATDQQAAPAPPAATPAPAMSKPAPRAPAPQAGKLAVQLATLPTRDGAQDEWARLSKKLPDLLGSRHPVIVPSVQDGKTLYRLRTGGFSDASAAASFCNQLRAKAAPCAVDHP